MKSIAITYKTKASNHMPNLEPHAEVHANLWKIPRKIRGHTRFLDIGVKITDFSNQIESVLFYFPFKIKNKNVLSDLGKRMTGNCDLLCTLFNSDLSINTDDNSSSLCYVKSLYNDDSNNNFWLYSLGPINFEVEDLEDDPGTFVTVKLMCEVPLSPPVNNIIEYNPSQESDSDVEVPSDTGCYDENFEDAEIKVPRENLYFRFRIFDNSKNGIKSYKHEESVSNDLIQSAFSSIDIIDFRLNDKREIDTKVLELIEKGKKFVFFKLKKVHLFFVADVNDEPANFSDLKVDSRILEHEKWDSYVEGFATHHKFIAYHWKISGKKGGKSKDEELFFNCNIFFKTIYRHFNIVRFLEYSLFAIMIGSIGSWLVSNKDSQFEYYYVGGLLGLLSITIIINNYKYLRNWFRFNKKL